MEQADRIGPVRYTQFLRPSSRFDSELTLSEHRGRQASTFVTGLLSCAGVSCWNDRMRRILLGLLFLTALGLSPAALHPAQAAALPVARPDVAPALVDQAYYVIVRRRYWRPRYYVRRYYWRPRYRYYRRVYWRPRYYVRRYYWRPRYRYWRRW